MADDDTKKEVAALKAEVEALKSALSGKEDKLVEIDVCRDERCRVA
jgi:hypothetical protein